MNITISTLCLQAPARWRPALLQRRPSIYITNMNNFYHLFLSFRNRSIYPRHLQDPIYHLLHSPA